MNGGSLSDNWKHPWTLKLSNINVDDTETNLLTLSMRLDSKSPEVYQG